MYDTQDRAKARRDLGEKMAKSTQGRIHTLTRGDSPTPIERAIGKNWQNHRAAPSYAFIILLYDTAIEMAKIRLRRLSAPQANIGNIRHRRRISNSINFNQNIPFSSKIPKFRARLRRAKVFSLKKVKSGKFSLKISKK